MKRFKGWCTRIVAIAHILVGALAVVDPNLVKLVTSGDPNTQKYGFVLIAQGVLIYVLRQITTTPPGERF